MEATHSYAPRFGEWHHVSRDLLARLGKRGRRQGLIRAASKATIDEEAPEAYKDATEVVDTTDGAGIRKKVARLRPLIVVKG
jgi:tRNA-splicing ligase RtcB